MVIITSNAVSDWLKYEKSHFSQTFIGINHGNIANNEYECSTKL